MNDFFNTVKSKGCLVHCRYGSIIGNSLTIKWNETFMKMSGQGEYYQWLYRKLLVKSVNLANVVSINELDCDFDLSKGRMAGDGIISLRSDKNYLEIDTNKEEAYCGICSGLVAE